MIPFSENIKRALNSDAIEYFSMVRIERATHETETKPINIYASTSHYNDIQLIDGADTNNPKYLFIADGTLLAADPPQNSSIVDREQYKIVFSDPEFTRIADLENSLVGRKIECRLGFIDPLDSKPMVNINDTIVTYRGRIDSANRTIKAGGLGESLISITGSSPMCNLDMKKPFFITREKVREMDAKDTSCDQVYEGSTNIIVKWGRK
jgi:hypothetical protein